MDLRKINFQFPNSTTTNIYICIYIYIYIYIVYFLLSLEETNFVIHVFLSQFNYFVNNI